MSAAAATADLPLSPEPRRYDLFLRHRAGFYWRLTDRGIVPGPEKLSYPVDGRMGYRSYSDIVSVNLSSAHIPRQGRLAQCGISFRNGATLALSSADARGYPSAAQAEIFSDFLADFHRRLLESGAAGHIRFTRGATEMRMMLLYAALILGAAIFIGLPIVLALVVRSWEPFEIMLMGALFLWPAWESARKNEPGTYNPAYPPDMLNG